MAIKIALRFTLFAACAVGEGHGSSLDSYGCHHNRNAGGYYCHRGQLAGQDFTSKAEMLDVLAAREASTSEAATSELAGRVVAVADGDTLTVLVSREQIKVRLLDIDAPMRKQPFGARSRQSLAELCHGKATRVAWKEKDRYGPLGLVHCAGLDANAEQVRRGMAWVYVRYAPKHSPLYAVQD